MYGSFLCSGYRVFPGGKEMPGRDADPSPLLVPWSRISSYTSTLPMGRTACTESHCLCKGALYLFTFMYDDLLLVILHFAEIPSTSVCSAAMRIQYILIFE